MGGTRALPEPPENIALPDGLVECIPTSKDKASAITRMQKVTEMVDNDDSASRRHAAALSRAARPLDRTWVSSFMLNGDVQEADSAGDLAALTSQAVAAKSMVLNAAFRVDGVFPRGVYDLHDDCSLLLVPCITIGGETVGIAVERSTAVNGTGFHVALKFALGGEHRGLGDREQAIGRFFFSASTGELLVLTRKMELEPMDPALVAMSLYAGLCGVSIKLDNPLISRPKMRVLWWSGVDSNLGLCRSLDGPFELVVSSHTLVALVDAERFALGQYSRCIVVSRLGFPSAPVGDNTPTEAAGSPCCGLRSPSEETPSNADRRSVKPAARRNADKGASPPVGSEALFGGCSSLVRWGGRGEIFGRLPGIDHGVCVPKNMFVVSGFDFNPVSEMALELRHLGISRSTLGMRVTRQLVGRPQTDLPRYSGTRRRGRGGRGTVLQASVEVRGISGSDVEIDAGHDTTRSSQVREPGNEDGDNAETRESFGGGGGRDVRRRKVLIARASRNRLSAARSNEARRIRNLKLREDLEALQKSAEELHLRRDALLRENGELRQAVGKGPDWHLQRRQEKIVGTAGWKCPK